MNTFLNLYNEFNCDHYEMIRQIEFINKTPLIARIHERGINEQYSAKYRPHYYGKSGTKRASKQYANNSLLLGL